MRTSASTVPTAAPVPDIGDPWPPGVGAGEIHRRLRHEILSGSFRPERRLSQVELAKELQVSRAPLREALRMLQREGLVESAPNRQARVAPLHADDLDELYGARIALESVAVMLSVPRMTQAEHYALSESLGEMSILAQSRDVDHWEVPHRRFHRLLVAHAGPRLCRLIDELSDHAERYRRRYLAEPRGWATGPREHAAIAEACYQGDAALASQRVVQHLARTALTLVMHMAPGHEPTAVRSALRVLLTEHEAPHLSNERDA